MAVAPVNAPQNVSVVDRIDVPRYARRFGGLDHGSSGRRLAQRRDASGRVLASLVWFSGRKQADCGVRGFGRSYRPARLTILGPDSLPSRDLHEGGRLTAAILARHASAVDERLGAGVATLLTTGATVVALDR